MLTFVWPSVFRMLLNPYVLSATGHIKQKAKSGFFKYKIGKEIKCI